MRNKKKIRARKIFGKKKKRTAKITYIVLVVVALVIFAFITYNYMLTCYHFAKFQNLIGSSADISTIESDNLQNNFAYNVEIRSSLIFLERLKASDIASAQNIVEQQDRFNYVDKAAVLEKLKAILAAHKQLEDLQKEDTETQNTLANLADRYHYYQNELRYIFRQPRQNKSANITLEKSKYVFYQDGVAQGMPVVDTIPEYKTITEIAMTHNLGKKQLQRLTADLSYTKWRVKGIEEEFNNLFKLQKEREAKREAIRKNEELMINELTNFALQNMLEQFYQAMPEFLVITYNFGVEINNGLASYIESLEILPKINQPQP
ncbi:MAG: hypothetical protein LBE20_06930 [Deltaproteobacteria bacterium]|jgi:hypothetical protein|nr:hypothetical protein [Deltaproteobacteria bacterium]